MKILLVSPASGGWRGIGRRRFFNGKTFRFSMLSLLTIASLTPQEHEVIIVDEQIENIPSGLFDLVGITVMTASAPRAYRIAGEFRKKGTPVVLGGFHVTLNPEEALGHADAVVAGEAYGAWERVLRDLENGRLRGRYRGERPPGETAALPRRILDDRGYVTVNATYATTGCNNRCAFCSISAVHNGKRHQRAIDEVVREIAAFRKKFFIFVDDNLTQDRSYALELTNQMAPLKKRWITQASVEVAEDDELLRAMRAAGCIGIFIGLETMNGEILSAQEKGFNKPRKYRSLVDNIHRHGMFVEAGIMFGFDKDSDDVFRLTLEALDEIGIDAVQASIVTPLPGTKLFDQMKSRIFDRNWEHYDYRHAVFTPRRMSADSLQAGADWFIRSFYSPRRIARRALGWAASPRSMGRMAYPLGLNLAYLGRVLTFRIKGHDPAAGTSSRRTPSSLEASTA